jgi:beta-galactosidase/beta-glucuronidase
MRSSGFRHCQAWGDPRRQVACGRYATHLVRLVCPEQHHVLLAACRHHADMIRMSPRPAVIDDCTGCEEERGVASRFSIYSIERWSADNPALLQVARDQADLEGL